MSRYRPADCEALMLAAGDAIIAAAPDGSILLWNPAAERIFGYTEEEALGQSLDLIVPTVSAAATGKGTAGSCSPAVRSTARRCSACRRSTRTGIGISIAFTVALPLTSSHEVESIAAIVRDETERWQEERALRDRLSELEALVHERGDV